MHDDHHWTTLNDERRNLTGARLTLGADWGLNYVGVIDRPIDTEGMQPHFQDYIRKVWNIPGIVMLHVGSVNGVTEVTFISRGVIITSSQLWDFMTACEKLFGRKLRWPEEIAAA